MGLIEQHSANGRSNQGVTVVEEANTFTAVDHCGVWRGRMSARLTSPSTDSECLHQRYMALLLGPAISLERICDLDQSQSKSIGSARTTSPNSDFAMYSTSDFVMSTSRPSHSIFSLFLSFPHFTQHIQLRVSVRTQTLSLIPVSYLLSVIHVSMTSYLSFSLISPTRRLFLSSSDRLMAWILLMILILISHRISSTTTRRRINPLSVVLSW